MKRIFMAVLLLSTGVSGVIPASGCGIVKDKHVITPDRKAQFGVANQAMPESARRGIAAMMAKHSKTSTPISQPQQKP